ncbi:hypothetical protein DAEQUDRAFT_57971 [Daedalea quercina L-15889]|uniref:GRF-type domain-containing protein n=1 Tax=Daedalea quercina L-15889 TaxID=1314783 RepID=A0A165SK78_9APHY|nr:hypothetical protein DAEQUDRAFT_57971 [Daedalea quercina L-15889]
MSATPARTTYIHRVNADPRGPDGEIRCTAHGELAVRFTSHTENNPYRDFYRCPKSNDDPPCRFFIWADDPKLVGAPQTPTRRRQGSPESTRGLGTLQQKGISSTRVDAGLVEPLTPQSAKRPRPDSPPLSQMSAMRQLPGAFPTTPTRSERPRNVATPSSALTPSQRRSRMDQIIAGIESARSVHGKDLPGQVPNVLGLDDRPGASSVTGTPGNRLAELDASQDLSKHEEDDPDVISQHSPSKRSRVEDDEEYEFSETGSLYSVGIQTSPRLQSQPTIDSTSERAVELELNLALDASLDGASDMRRPYDDTLPPEYVSATSPPIRSFSRDDPLGHSGDPSQTQGYLTPPESSELQPDTMRQLRRGSVDPVDSRWKDKDRDPGDQLHPRWQFEDDPENPFQDRSSSMRELLADSAHGFESSRVEDSRPQACGEGAPLPLADYVAAQLEGMLAVPDHIRKLERQLKAAHNSIAARDRKIQELQQETERLQTQNRALEERLTARR